MSTDDIAEKHQPAAKPPRRPWHAHTIDSDHAIWRNKRDSGSSRRSHRVPSPSPRPSSSAASRQSAMALKYATSPLNASFDAHGEHRDEEQGAASASSDGNKQALKPCIRGQAVRDRFNQPHQQRKHMTIDAGSLAGLQSAIEEDRVESSGSTCSDGPRRLLSEKEIAAQFYPSWKNISIDMDDEDLLNVECGASSPANFDEGDNTSTMVLPYAVPEPKTKAAPQIKRSTSFKGHRGFFSGIKGMIRRAVSSDFRDGLVNDTAAPSILSSGHRHYSCDGGVVMF